MSRGSQPRCKENPGLQAVSRMLPQRLGGPSPEASATPCVGDMTREPAAHRRRGRPGKTEADVPREWESRNEEAGLGASVRHRVYLCRWNRNPKCGAKNSFPRTQKTQRRRQRPAGRPRGVFSLRCLFSSAASAPLSSRSPSPLLGGRRASCCPAPVACGSSPSTDTRLVSFGKSGNFATSAVSRFGSFASCWHLNVLNS